MNRTRDLAWQTRRTSGDWRDEAKCAEYGPDDETWFPVSLDREDERTRDRQWLEAKAICAACPSRLPCLADALAYETEHPTMAYGLRAGLTPRERVALIRRRQRRTKKEVA